MAEEKERKIPLFSVTKNGAILKNIFVINKSPQIGEELNDQEESEEILIVGRHPDCNIMLTHPSISRFHLQIHSRPSSQKLSLLDLSSVHGTWVSGKRIDPGVMVELKEGDTIKIGGSTRLYKLQWIPISRAYDVENPFTLDLENVAVEDEKEEESKVEHYQGENTLSNENGCTEGKDSLLVEKKEEEQPFGFVQDQSPVTAEDEELQSMCWILEGIVSLFSDDENSEVFPMKEIPSALPMPENLTSSLHDEEYEITLRNNLEESKLLDLQSETPSNVLGELILAVEGVISESLNELSGEDKESMLLETVEEFISDRENELRSLRKSGLQHEHSENIDPSCLQLELYSASETVGESGNKKPLQETQQNSDVLRVPSEPLLQESFNSTSQEKDALLKLESQQVDRENLNPKPLSSLKEDKENEVIAAEHQQFILMENRDFTFSGNVEDARDENISRDDLMSENTSFYSASFPTESVNSSFLTEGVLSERQQFILMENRDFTFPGYVEDARNENISREGLMSENTSFYSASLPTESVNSSFPTGGVLSEPSDDKRYSTPQSILAPTRQSEDGNFDISLRLDKKSNMHSIWSRRGKPASVLEIQTGRSAGKTVEATNNSENKIVLKSLFVSSEEEEEIFTPDKENFTQNSLLKKALQPKGKLGEIKDSSKATFSPNLQPEEEMITTDKENQTPTYIKEIKSARKSSQNQPKLEQERVMLKRKAERVPFQSLLVDSACKSLSEGSATNNVVQSNSVTLSSKKIDKMIASSSLNKSVGEVRGTWTMVADTTSLMDKESRKSLQLLQGLKGTRLIIPRMVIRELDCLKQRGSLFRRKTEASLILEWIEECMVSTKWWIHVQSTMEGGGLTAPTPPATPPSQFDEGSMGNPFGTMTAPFSAWRSLKEITSPTAEDHILDCTLLFRRMKSDGQVILLSNDITLKIKAMAEGLTCETVQEFRQSLLNPFSERFMWADSSARGQTWSTLDDVVLREKYYPYPLKKPSKGDAKGLKLILLHNSHYGHINSVR